MVPSPSVPKPLAPQHRAAPEATAQAKPLPTSIAVTPDDSPDTGTGTLEAAPEASPSGPVPQHQAPPAITAHARVDPTAIAVTPDDNPVTGTGTFELVAAEPLPSIPPVLLPQQCAAPDTTAHEVEYPTAICVTPAASPDTGTGTFELIVEPSPSWPDPLSPQHHAAPDRTAHEDERPPAIAVTPDDSPATSVGASILVRLEPAPT